MLSSSSSSDSSYAPATPDVTPMPGIKEESTAPARRTTETKPSVSSPTHVIDPMNFSIRPIPKGMKSTTPVVGSNPASATSHMMKGHLAATGKDVTVKESDDDLMTFSVTPTLLGISKNQQPENSVPVVLAPAQESPKPVGDLIEFSLTPAVLNKYKSSAVYNPSSRISRRSLSSYNPHPPFSSPSASPVTSKKSPQLSSFNPSNTKFGQLYSASSTTPTNSPSQLRSNTKMTSNSGNLQSHAASSEVPKFYPKWDHFGDQEPPAKATVVPQKLLPSQEWQNTQVDVASGSHDHGRVSPASPSLDRQRREGKKLSFGKVQSSNLEDTPKIQENWTMVSKTNSSQDDSDALRHLKRIVSQPGFENEKEALVPMGKDMNSPELLISTVNMSKGYEDVSRHSPTQLTKLVRGRADPLPSLPSSGKNSSDRTAHLQKTWFPQWESTQNPKDAHPRNEPWQSKSDNKYDKLDYADLDLTTPGYARVRSKSPEFKSNPGSVDYTEIVFPPSNVKSSPKTKKKDVDDYANLADLTISNTKSGSKKKDVDDYTSLADLTTDVRKMGKNSAMPLGYDPDYAVPEKIARRVQKVNQWDKDRSSEARHQNSSTHTGEVSSSGKQSPSVNKETRGRSSSPFGSTSPQSHRHHIVSPHSGDLSDISKCNLDVGVWGGVLDLNSLKCIVRMHIRVLKGLHHELVRAEGIIGSCEYSVYTIDEHFYFLYYLNGYRLTW